MSDPDEPTIEEVVAYTSGSTGSPPDLRLLHYNDVYHVEAGSREPVGGIARFQTLCKYYKGDTRFHGQPDLIPLFSGDAFNPSLESSVTKDPALGDDVSLGNCQKTLLVTSSNGIKIGLIGLVEREWLDTINVLPPNLIYKSASATAEELVPGLREQGAEMIIAITHQREPNDNKLAETTSPGLIDLVLGGHDHYYQHSLLNGTHILRSGSDFKQLSYIEARRKADGTASWDFTIYRRDIVQQIPEDKSTVELVEKLTSALKAKLEKPVGYTAAPLDARFTTVRLKESNLGNFVCDLMRSFYQADCCIMAAGTVRGDQIYPPGVLKMKDIMNCFPFEDPCVVIRLKGKALLGALENSVSKYPALEGRFPQVSNIEIIFDASKPEGNRIIEAKVGGTALVLDRDYTLVTRDYMVRGKDGFDDLMLEGEGGKAQTLVSEENGMLISMILRQYFMSLKVLGRWKNWGSSLGRHWTGVQGSLHEHHPVREPVHPEEKDAAELKEPVPATSAEGVPSLVGKAQNEPRPVKKQRTAETDDVAQASDSEDDSTDLPAVAVEPSGRERELVIMRKVMRKWWRLAGMHGHPAMCDEMGEEFGVHWTKGICPKLEGRIKMVGG
ncbi:hypothetical protein H2203_007884 [Taxawa tesnikishii (nom. ined.)]|nr:hypothetical protein H2203_007884 [Dothideales sp. JES 119]